MDIFSPEIIILTLFLGSFAGFVAGLLGIGGGVILVPLFLWLFSMVSFPADLIVHTAFGTSLAVILPTAISSTLAHRKRGNVDWQMVAFLALGGVLGSLLGSSVAAVIPGDKLKMYFGLMQILVSLKLLFYKPYIPPENMARVNKTPLLLVGFAGGLYSSFFGVGGGVVAVPLMLICLQLPIHLAVGNSSALIVVSSLSAVICYIWFGIQDSSSAPFSIGYVNLLVAFLVAPLAMICARIGVKLASHTSHDKLVKIFAILLMLVGGKILLGL